MGVSRREDAMAMTQESGPGARPRVLVAVGTSVDGRVTLRREGLLMDEKERRVWESMNPPSAAALSAARESYITERYHPQAYLEGSGSLVTDDVGPRSDLPTDFDEPVDLLYTDFIAAEVLERPGHAKWFTVVDSRGRVTWDMKSGGEFDVLVLVAKATPAPYLAYLRRERVCYLVVGEERVDLELAMRRMGERLGVTCVLSTAGGGLNGALLRAGLIDELHLQIFPSAVGGLGTPSLFDGPALGPGEYPTRLRLLFAHTEADGMLWLRYEVVREE